MRPGAADDADGQPFGAASNESGVTSDESLVCNLLAGRRIAPTLARIDDDGAVVLIVLVASANDD